MKTLTSTRRPFMVARTTPRFRAFWIGLALAFCPFAVLPAEQLDLFTYQVINGSEVEITDYPESEPGEVVIPSEINGMPVTSIGACTFSDCGGLTGVIIPGGVTSIGASTFINCGGLTNVRIPEGVTNIGDGVFSGCSGLIGVILPEGVASIGDGFFAGCSSLASIRVPSSVAYIGIEAFYGCRALTSVTIGKGVTEIHPFAFGDCVELRSVVCLGDAPMLVGNDDRPIFRPTVMVYYLRGSARFTSPTWQGYSSVEIDQSLYPAAVWLLTHGLGHDTDLRQDINGDGVILLNAYALGLDPNNALAGMPVPILDPGTMRMTFYGAAPGVSYGAETSTDLQTWVTEGATISDLDPANMRTATVDRDSTRRFLRLTFGMSP